jgi:hypothetical protein
LPVLVEDSDDLRAEMIAAISLMQSQMISSLVHAGISEVEIRQVEKMRREEDESLRLSGKRQIRKRPTLEASSCSQIA